MPSLPRLLRLLTRSHAAPVSTNGSAGLLWYHRAAAVSDCFRWLRWFPFGCDTVKNVAFLGRFCRVEPVRHTVLATDETGTPHLQTLLTETTGSIRQARHARHLGVSTSAISRAYQGGPVGAGFQRRLREVFPHRWTDLIVDQDEE